MKMIIFALSMVFLNQGYTSPKDLLNSWEIQRHSLKEIGVRDFKFNIRIKDQAKELNAQKRYGEVKDLYYTVYWLHGTKLDVKVNGIDGKWYTLKSNLKANIYSLLEVLFPTSLFDVTRGYKLSKVGSLKVRAEDESYKKAFQEMLFSFSKVGALEEIKSKNALGTQILTFISEKERAAKNNFVVKKIIKKNFYGPNTLNSTVQINYKNFKNYYLPASLNLESIVEIPEGEKKEEKRVEKSTTGVEIFGFSVNENVAKKYFSK